MALQTRKPTGAVPWPLVLVEGGEKSGKSWAGAVLTGSDRVGRSYWIDFAEGSGDEYGAVPGARYEIVIHDGTFNAIHQAVADVHAEAVKARAAGEKPLVLVIDSMTAEWDLLKDWATLRARSSKKNREALAKDPNAEIKVTTNYWNDANGRHKQIMKLLMTFPGIVIMVARGGVTALIENGAPVEGKKSYAVEGQKRLAFDASVWIRLSKDHRPLVVGARSVHHGIRPGIDEPKTLSDDWTLDNLIFDLLKCDPDTAHVRDLVDPVQEMLPEDIRDEAVLKTTGFERIRELYTLAKTFLTAEVVNETGGDEALGDLLIRLGRERQAAATTSPAARTPERSYVSPEDSPARAELDRLTDQAGAAPGEVVMSNQHQQETIAKGWSKLRIDGRAEQLARIAEVIGRTVTTEVDLTALEAMQVFDWQTMQTWDTPPQQPDADPAPAGPSPKARAKMHALWGEIGYGGSTKLQRDRRIAATSKMIKRAITSSNELTLAEIDTVIAGLEAKRDKDKAAAEQREPELAGASR